MVRSGDPEATSEIWGTLEELLLACAVSRHGTWSWDLVAMEVRSRSPSAHHLLLTPEGCKERYRDLERRFSTSDGKIGGGPGLEIPWLEELRKLRVAELRREVQRYDGSILSLQLKVKKLQEEREQSLLEGADGKRRPDLKEKEGKKNGESPRSTPGNNPGNRISGDSGRSCEESNSTDPKDDEEKPRVGPEKAEAAPDAENKSPDRVTGGDVKSAGEASYNGSSDTIAKAASVANTARPLPLGDSGESMAESKGGEPEAEREGTKETSDVQSSASLSRRRRRRRRGGRRKVFSGCSSGGDEPEADAVSPGGERVAAESQPLITFVELIRAHKFGSVFERRLESQDSVRYRSMIRRHVDLEMVRAKLERGGGKKAYTSAEVFRDLLLLCYNAIVFYAKSSPESIAAVHLRGLVTKEMARIIRKPARPPKAEEPAPPAQPFPPPPVSKLKSEPDRASEPLEKQTSLVPLTACRKRSSLCGKAAAAAAAAGWKEGKEENEKHQVDRKEREVEEDETPAKKRTKEGSSVSGPRGLRSNKTAGNAGNRGNGVSKSLNSISSPIIKSTAVETSTEATAKSAKKNGGGEAVSASKKKGAAEFLIRMKRSSPMSNGKLRNTLRSSASSGGSGGGKGGDQQKKGGRGDGRKDRDSRQSPGAAASKRAAENSGPVKRSVGRPPKRAAAPPPPPPAKRAKDELGRRPSSRNRVRR
ncbi:serine/arginine repetitive matrix protein 1 [Cocos nucifera]|uniref:Serine/arginine repetitive matrix protein 1 n=1 Tax=Cocos nucifera TaxID=13894 RepID=A0A8K0HU76_COCNU|nr:serine/arginine repetitive matrix protein 1 [Cocos nucifera]